MKVLIIEDEKPSARRLQRMLESLELEVVELLHSVKESVVWFKNNEAPELIFLDIQLSDGLSFEIFQHVEVHSPIIFTTAYDEYALKAFKLNSVDYLLKPIDDEELKAAVDKFKSTWKISSETKDLDLNKIKQLLNDTQLQNYKTRFMIQVGAHLKIIESTEVCCFYSENKGTYLRSSNDRTYLLDSSLDKLEIELDPEKFFRVNRKFIVSRNSIEDIISYSNTRYELKLKGFKDYQIIVSRERVKAFKEWLS
jgi:two-component system, LytTR family, response regulator LytT